MKFFVATKEHSQFMNNANLDLKNIYLIRRENMLHDSKDVFELENEIFEVFNLTKDLNDISIKLDDGKLLT